MRKGRGEKDIHGITDGVIAMGMSDRIHKRLNGRIIIGKDQREYILQISQGNPLSIDVVDIEDRYRRGILPCLVCIDHDKRILSREMADFTAVHGQGLYKKLINMISYAIPSGTTYQTAVANLDDQDSLIKSAKSAQRKKEELSVKPCLENTLIGHVFYSSKFRDIRIFYRNMDDTVFEGEKALRQFSRDDSRDIFPHRHGTQLYIMAKKTKPFN